jgi:hypothetical protein
MLDAGLSLEDSRQAALDRTASTPANEWDKAALESFKEGTRATTKGFLLKLAYGSDFPYREAEQFVKTGIRLRRDSWVSVMYSPELNSATSSVIPRRTDRHGILGEKPSDFHLFS